MRDTRETKGNKGYERAHTTSLNPFVVIFFASVATL
jgi:hypothetical protein